MSTGILFDGHLTEGPGHADGDILNYFIFNGLCGFCLFVGRLMGYAFAKINREFFQYQLPYPLHEIDAELGAVEKRIMALLREVTE